MKAKGFFQLTTKIKKEFAKSTKWQLLIRTIKPSDLYVKVLKTVFEHFKTDNSVRSSPFGGL